MSDLKPCPFCGGEASIFEDSSHSTAYEVACFNGDCKVEPHVWEETKSVAIDAWNTRTIDPAAIWREAIEAAAAAIDVDEAGYYCIPSYEDAHALNRQIEHCKGAIRNIPNPYEAKP